LEELYLDPVEKKLAQHEQKWLNHVNRWKTLGTRSNYLAIDLSETESLAVPYRDH